MRLGLRTASEPIKPRRRPGASQLPGSLAKASLAPWAGGIKLVLELALICGVLMLLRLWQLRSRAAGSEGQDPGGPI